MGLPELWAQTVAVGSCLLASCAGTSCLKAVMLSSTKGSGQGSQRLPGVHQSLGCPPRGHHQSRLRLPCAGFLQSTVMAAQQGVDAGF